MSKPSKKDSEEAPKTISLPYKATAEIRSDTVQHILATVREALADTPGVVGLALGGSWARGTATPESDVDIGLFFAIRTPAELATIYQKIARLDDRSKSDPDGVYEWGPYNSPGYWHISGMDVDVSLRDSSIVQQAIYNCSEGNVEIVHEAGRLRGISTAVFAGEVYHNLDFYDPRGVLADLRKLTDPYPEKLAHALIKKFGQDAATALGAAVPAASRGDVVYVYGCAYRAAACLNELLFAAERRYLLDDKRAVEAASAFALAPPQYGERVAHAFSLLSIHPKDMLAAIQELQSLQADVSYAATASLHTAH